jgi:SAM-dependent methyltransferase
MMNDFSEDFNGQKLYGDDFSLEQIEQWYKDEQEAFTDMYVRPSQGNYRYPYHSLDLYHGFNHIPNVPIKHALGIGSATGEEFLPIIKRIQQITILEPTDLYREWDNIQGVPAQWIKPEVSGDLKFELNTFDLITCFSVLHHIPNVSHILDECVRVLKPGGFLLIREPVTSMGDWRAPRRGVTKRERGIPLPFFRHTIANSGLKVLYESSCNFPGLDIFSKKLFHIEAYNTEVLTITDFVISKMFAWNYRYHRTNIFQKIAPRSICFVLEKV